ncbi:MAG: amidohydrolase family protein [Blastocatellia bacterium]|nr:amidohydrolase family protein [Blastocatellia bacterium]
MKNNRYLTLACAVALALTAVNWAATRGAAARGSGDDAYAISGGTVVTVTGATIPNGVVVIRNGLITAVGANVPIPADARVIDAKGMMVYPGLIDSYTSLGISAPAPQTQGRGRGGGPPAVAGPAAASEEAEPPGLQPELMAADELKVTADTFDPQRSTGVTTALSASRTGLFRGQSAIINLGGDEPEKLILKSPASLNVGFNTARGAYPGSLLGVFAYMRQSLLDAQHYREEWARYNRNKRGVTRPQVDKSLEALQPVINGELPVIFWAESVREMKRAVAMAEEFKLKYMIAGGTESYEIADWLKQKNATVLVSLNYPQRPANIDDPESESLRVLRGRANAPKSAGALSKAGVRFALQSGNLSRPQDFLANAARAIEAGLPKDEAIKAMTLYPAQILGIAEQLGSIEQGKIANIVVTSGDLFDKKTQVKHVFVDGKPYTVKAPAASGGGRGPGGRTPGGGPGGGGGMAAGSWSITISSPNGEVEGTLTLRQSGDSVSGEISSPFGTFPVTGHISGNQLTYEYTANIQGEQIPISASGTIEGNSIRGTMSAMGTSFGFTGTRTPR